MAIEKSMRNRQVTSGEGLMDERVDSAASCPASRAIELVAHKWTIQILFALHEAGEAVRFRNLQRAVEPITQKELTKRLRDLERAGMVHRQVFAEVPPRVEYRLTELGSSLIPALLGLHEWAEQHGVVVEQNRERATLDSSKRR
jgi:DNA-binding HxlR family transcriptional regulator